MKLVKIIIIININCKKTQDKNNIYHYNKKIE